MVASSGVTHRNRPLLGVIPAKAGTHFASRASCELDPSFRWDDTRWVGQNRAHRGVDAALSYALPVKLRYGNTAAPRLGISPATTATVTTANPSDW